MLERLVDACARSSSASRPRSCARATSSSPSRCPITRIPTAITTSAISRARCAPASRRRTAPDSRGARRKRGRAARSADSAFRAISNAPPGTRASRARSALERNGDFTVLIGTQSNGQGHETAYAQVVSQYLDVPLERIKVVQGDTDRIADRRRDRRIAIDPDRRGDGDTRLANSGRFAQGSGGRQARGRGRRPGNRGRKRAHRRNGPRDLLCRDRRPAFGDGGEIDRDRVRSHRRAPPIRTAPTPARSRSIPKPARRRSSATRSSTTLDSP